MTNTLSPSQSLDPKHLFAGINTGQPVIVAVSGGGDSMALLLLASAWSKMRNVDLFAVTVDHGLRPEAAAEAAFVASVCESLQVTHVTLAWDGIKPTSGLPEASRKARYILLEEFAGQVGARTIMCAHTADDQAETLAMRLSREVETSIGRGLSGMSRITLLADGVRLFRPFLGVLRSDLRTYLTENGQSWIEDPSNKDLSYERVRVRHQLTADPERKARLIRFAQAMGRRRKVIADRVAGELAARVQVMPGSVISLKTSGMFSLPDVICQHLLQVLLATVGGAQHLPSISKLQAIVEAMRFANANPAHTPRLTCCGCVIDVSAKSLRLYREARNLQAVLVGPGDQIIWDGRLSVQNGTGTTVFVGPFEPALRGEAEEQLGVPIRIMPKAALKALPVIKADGDAIFLPTFMNQNLPDGIRTRVTAVAIESFCPEFDFALLDWLRELDLKVSETLQSRN